MTTATLKLVHRGPLSKAAPCHFRLAHKYGRGSNRRAIYVCIAHPYPSGCLPFATKVAKPL